MNKKGLSAIVTTLLVILLVLVAVGIVWGVVRNIIQEGAKGVGSGARCLNIDVEAISVSCTDNVCGGTLERTGSDNDEIGGVKLVFYSDTGNSGVIPQEGNIEALVGKSFSNIDTSLSEPNRVDVTVYLVDDSGNEQLCSQTTSTNINVGSGGDDGGDDGDEPPGGGDGNCVSECGLRICGPDPDPDCEEPCGTCETGTCSEDGLECIGCTSKTCEELGFLECTPEGATNGCGAPIDCGSCDPGELCNNVGVCELVTALVSVNIEEVWPSTGIFIASSEFTDYDEEGYVDYSGEYSSYTNGVECIRIFRYITTDLSGYDKVIVELTSNPEPVIAQDDTYYIWNDLDECAASL